MSIPKAKIVVMVALAGAALVVACGSGSDPVIDLGSPFQQRAGDFAKPTTSNQDPSPAQMASAGGAATANPQGTGNDRDGGSSGNTSGGTSGNTSGGTSGNTSGGTSGTTAGCPPCDGAFTCTVTVTGQPAQQTPVTLTTKNGACVFSSASASGDVTFACGGALLSGGQNVGTWSNCAKTAGGTPTPVADGG